MTLPTDTVLLNNASATGPLVEWPGGIVCFSCVGTFNGGTVSLNVRGPDGSTMIVAGNQTSLSASGMGVAWLPYCYVQAVVTGSPSGLYATIARVRI